MWAMTQQALSLGHIKLEGYLSTAIACVKFERGYSKEELVAVFINIHLS